MTHSDQRAGHQASHHASVGDAPPTPRHGAAERGQVVVKKYANRRLYNTESSSYITLDNLADMVRAGRDFVVYDAKSGDDITRSVLTQIIVEEESQGHALLPTTFLRQLIGFYGDSMGNAVPRYLEQTMSAIARQQEQMREAVQQTMGSLLPPGLEEMRRQNLAMMERAINLFTPFYKGAEPDPAPSAGEPGTPVLAPADEVVSLREEVASLRQALAASQAARPVLTQVPTDGPAAKQRHAAGS